MQSNTDIHGFIKSAAIRVYKSALSAFQQKIMTQKEQLQLGKDYPDDTPQDVSPWKTPKPSWERRRT
jgi:hypothetical protein